MKVTVLFFFVLSLFLRPVAEAQKTSQRATKSPPPSDTKLIAFKVTGTVRYTDQEILSASGLQLGQNFGEGDFKEAVRRLGDTGLFTDIAFSYSYSDEGTKLEFQLTDAPQKNVVPIHFENFVWFTDAELLAGLKRQIPLFTKEVPVEGGYPDKIAAALQSLLDEKHLPGHVDYLRQGKPDGSDLTGIAYRVVDVDIRIHSFEFPGASPEQQDLLKTATRRYIGADYDRDALETVARIDCLPVYLQRGFLKADFAEPGARVESASDSGIEVQAILPISPGEVYSTSDVAWKGNAAIATSQLQTMTHLPPGQAADAVRLQADLEAIGKLYRDQGYMMARVNVLPTMDDAKSAVHYDLNVVEGDQFKMGDLDIVGLDSESKARLTEAWSLAEGQPYNASYPKKFLETSFRALPGGAHWNASINQAVNESDKTVDVTITFTPR